MEWFRDLSELYMCILIDITEQSVEYIDSAGSKISKSKAKKKKNNWPEWLMHDDGTGGTLTLQEETVRRMGGRIVRTKKEGCKVLILDLWKKLDLVIFHSGDLELEGLHLMGR